MPVRLEKNSAQRVFGLDVLRVLAVVMVLVFHYDSKSGHALFFGVGKYGWMGVDLFFVLSGYLIGTQLFRPLANGQPISLTDFLLKRVLRTFPNFLVVLAVYFLFAPLRERSDLSPLWKYLTFTQNLGLRNDETGAFSHAWSLCVEEQFYLFLPILSIFAFKRGDARKVVTALIAVVLFGIVLRTSLWIGLLAPVRETAENFSGLYYQFLYYPTWSRLDGLVVGVALAMTKVFRPKLWDKLLDNGPRALGVAGLFLAIAWMLAAKRYSTLSAAFLFPSVAFGFGALLVASISPRVGLSSFKIPGVSLLATLSYGIYLVQKLVFHGSESFLPTVGIAPFSYFGFFLTLLLCVGVASVLYVCVERPFLKLRERLIQERRKIRSAQPLSVDSVT